MDKMPCSACGEPIDVEAERCPYCGDKKWTRDRTLLYLVAYLPITALVIGLFSFELFVAPGFSREPAWWVWAWMLFLYVPPGLWTWKRHTDHRRRVEEISETKEGA